MDKTIIIKNSSTAWDCTAAFAAHLYLSHVRTPKSGYMKLFNDLQTRYKIKIDVVESEEDDSITFTIRNAEAKENDE